MIRVRVLAGLTLTLMSAAAFGCDIPKLVVIPDAENVAGHEKEINDAVTDYMTAMQTYTDCIKQELDSAGGDDAPELTRKLLVQRNNAAVAEADVVLKWLKQSVGGDASAGPPAPKQR
jgi:hypothetical protein